MGFSLRSRSGYEYSYGFSLIGSPSEAGNQVIFQIRTCFTLRDTCNYGGYQIMLDAEEGMSVILPLDEDEGDDDPYGYFDHVSYRLDQYLMSEADIQTLIQQALDFAGTAAAIIAIDINVCTVRLDGETVDEAIHRSVRPECLVPLDLVRPDVAAAKEDESYLLLREYLLFGLPRIRAEDLHVDGFGPLMDTCPICSGGPTPAAPVSLLPCMHAFHTHCIVRWLLESESCPMCLLHAAEGGGVKKEADLDWPVTQAPSTNHLPSPAEIIQVKEEELDWSNMDQAQSTNHLPGTMRVRRAPAWHRDYVIGGGMRVRG